MPRIGRVVVVGLPHHITQRGNFRQKVFHTDRDRKIYLSWVKEYSNKYNLSILVYCLMPNHVHFIATPGKEDSLAKAFNTIHMRYSQYINKKMHRTGHLWQGRFYSCVLDEIHLTTASKYIERNPVRANMIRKPWQWKWSSALAHISNNSNSLVKSENLFRIIDMPCDSWKKYIDSKDDKKDVKEMRKHTLTGRPLGRTVFIENLERRFGRRFQPLPRGRPRKEE